MSVWAVRDAFDVAVVGKRLAALLLAVAAYYAASGLLIQRFGIQQIDHGSAGSLINTVILSLLMSFRNSAAYKRWWEARSLWGRLVNDSRNLAAKCAAQIPKDALAESRLADILAGFAESLKRRLRDEPHRLRELPGFERETADPTHVPQYLARRLFGVVSRWNSEGKLVGPAMLTLDIHARGLLDVCGGCEKIKNTPLSPSYKGLLRMGLLLNVLVAPWLAMPTVGFWGLPVILLVCFFLFGVELIDTIVEEPFGLECDDLDLDLYCNTIRASVFETLQSEDVDSLNRGDL